jgi:hypothetical protein
MSDQPRVWNKKDPKTPADAVYVGRPTKWGNPFKIGRDGTRAEVLAKYRCLFAELRLWTVAREELKGKHLVCWCAPAPCHADFLLEVANAPPGSAIKL